MRPILLAAFLVGACLPILSSGAVTSKNDHSPTDTTSLTSTSVDSVQHEEETATALIKQKLGSGTFATVFRAELSGVPAPVALKVIHKMRFTRGKYIPWTEMQLKSIATEVLILDTLFSHETNQHPALLLKSYGMFEDRDNVYMAMELGLCDMFKLLDNNYPLPVPVVQSIMVDVVRCVAALHEAKVMVRDIKCDNIVIGHEGQAMLIDFNLAKNDGTLEDSEVRGTADYLAFEIADIGRFKKYTHKVDSWSIGCVMVVMVTKEFPFDTANLKEPILLEAIRKVLEKGVVDADAVTRFDPNMTEVVVACLDKNPETRPSAKELLEYPYFKDAREDDLMAARQWLVETLREQPMEDDDNDDLTSATNFTRQWVKETYKREFREAMPKTVPMRPVKVVIGGEE